MNKQMIEDILQWEKEYLTMNKKLTDREKEILKGDSIKTNEGMVFGRMYADWKNKKVTIMNDEYLEEQIIEQIKVLVEELGGNLKQLTRVDSTDRMSKIIEIEYNINE